MQNRYRFILVNIILYLFILFLINASCAYFIRDTFEYYGFIYYPPVVSKGLITSIALGCLGFLLISIKADRPSAIVGLYIYFFHFIPSSFAPYILVRDVDSGYNSFLFAELIGIIILTQPFNIKLNFTANFKLSNVLYVLMGFLAIISMTIGSKFSIPSLSEVYSIRDEFHTSKNETSSIVQYIYSWTGNIVNPLVIVVFLLRKQKLYIILAVIVQVYLFSISGLKNILSVPLFILMFYYFIKLFKYRSLLFPAILITIMGLCDIIDLVTGSIIANTIFTRRIFSTIGHLNYLYYDFTLHNPLYYLQHSIFSRFVDRIYLETPPFRVALEYFNTSFSANAGMYPDAYINFGIAGVLFYTIVLKVILSILDAKFLEIDSDDTNFYPLMLAYVMTIFRTVTETSLFTALLTHGILLGTVIVVLILSTQSNSKMVNAQTL